MELNAITAIIVDEAYQIHRELGPGIFESIYELVLADALVAKGLRVARQVPIPIRVRGKIYDEGFRADLIVEDLVIVEIKSVEQLGAGSQEAGSNLPQTFRSPGRAPDQFRRRIIEGQPQALSYRRRRRFEGLILFIVPLRELRVPPCETFPLRSYTNTDSSPSHAQSSSSDHGRHRPVSPAAKAPSASASLAATPSASHRAGPQRPTPPQKSVSPLISTPQPG